MREAKRENRFDESFRVKKKLLQMMNKIHIVHMKKYNSIVIFDNFY